MTDLLPKESALIGGITHRPRMIGCIRHPQRVRFVPFQSFLRPDPQVQLQFAVNPIDSFVVPAKALHIAQIQKAKAKAPGAPIAGQLHKPFRNLCVLVTELALISIATFADAERDLSPTFFGGITVKGCIMLRRSIALASRSIFLERKLTPTATPTTTPSTLNKISLTLPFGSKNKRINPTIIA